MKRSCFATRFTLAVAVVALVAMNAAAQHRPAPRIVHVNNPRMFGGNGGPVITRTSAIFLPKNLPVLHNVGNASPKPGDIGLPIQGRPIHLGNGNNNSTNNISIVLGGGGFGGGGFGGYSSGVGGYSGGIVANSAPPLPQLDAISDAPSQAAPVVANDTPPAPAVAQAADSKDNIDDGEVERAFTRRLLKVKNDSGLPMKVYVQYRGQDDKKWAWVPAAPNESKDALVYELTPGQEIYLQHNGSKLSASRVRIWGVADAQTWFDYRDQDLWVVPEMDQRGEHRYQATDMRTFTFVFPKQDTVAAK